MNKNGIVTSPADLMKGLLIGFILGVIVIFLGVKGIIPIPFLK